MDRDHHPEAEAHRPLRVLLVTTKLPWPPIDGGRLLVAETLQALDPAEVEVTLVGPWSDPSEAGQDLTVPAIRRVESAGSRPTSLARLTRLSRLLWESARATLRLGGIPATALRHRDVALTRRVRHLLNHEQFDVIHAEQPHALESIPLTSVPILLRAQNVEADLWERYAAAASNFILRFVLAGQSAAVARWEQATLVRATFTAAISEDDQQSFQRRSPPEEAAKVHVLPPAFPAVRARTAGPAASAVQGEGAASGSRLAGEPSVVLFGGSSWRPNRLGESAFLKRCWPQMLERQPGAVLHLFSPPTHSTARTEPAEVVTHAPPADAGDALVAGSVLAVPATVTSGVRMKILEAFSRGLCVITTTAGARGLGPDLRQAVLVADQPKEWGHRLAWLSEADNFATALASGRRALEREHDPRVVAATLTRTYRRCRQQQLGRRL